MSTPADRRREEAFTDEFEEWAAEQVARLWDVHAEEIPYNDAEPEGEKIGGMDIWITLIEDRHANVEALPFSSEEAAFAKARDSVPDDAEEDELNDAMRKDGWVLYLPYGPEGDCVRVIRRTLDDPHGRHETGDDEAAEAVARAWNFGE